MQNVPERKIFDGHVQARTMAEIVKHGVDQLIESILRNGFLSMDRVVVRKIESSDFFVTVEGNRRIAALKRLREKIDQDLVKEDNISDDYLENLISDTDRIEVLEYTGPETGDIAWMLQGIRHVSGIREWEPAQRGRLVANQIEKHQLGFREAGQHFGLSAIQVGRYYRTHKALEQMRNDEEYQDKARNDYFTLFEESIRNKSVKGWLGWNNKEMRFDEENNLQQFYSWITPDEDNEEKRRRIHDPRQIKILGQLIAGEHDDLLNSIDHHDITIEGARDRANQLGQKHEWRKALDRAKFLISELSSAAIEGEPREVLKALTKIEEVIAVRKRMAESVAGEND